MPACAVCALDHATLVGGICATCRRDPHVTRADADLAESRFRCVCTCGWKSDEHAERGRAVAAGRVHRANARVQAL